MKKLLSTLLFFLLVATAPDAISQTKGPQASFASETHDFGKINETDGPVTFKFEFTNIGSTPLILSNVAASCGCTTPSWPKEPILPGAKSSIVVTYNPANRPGSFTKTITVTSNSEPASQVLKIMGNVVPKQPTIEDQFPTDIDSLRLKSTQIAMNNIAPEATSVQTMEVYNNSGSNKKIAFNKIPNHIKIKITPETIKPKTKAIIEVTYDAKVKNDWGFVFDAIEMSINDKTTPNSRITVTANIQENFTQLTPEQKLAAPKIEIENANFDFGKIKQGETVKVEYVFKNVGNSDLIIRKLAPSCGCTVVENKTKLLKPGEKGTISAEFNSTGRTGAQSKTISVISNDPTNSKSILWIKGTVE